MTPDDKFATPLDLDELLLSKALEPLAPNQVAVLERIQNRDVTGFNEAEVRSYVIDPIVQILGYDKGTIFSADLEHPIKFLGKSLKPDYQVALWNENFWLIEAKKPRSKQSAFRYADLRQAIEYSVHPTINAALVALCDGVKFEVFDREVSVEKPLLSLRIKDLVRDFDNLRAILEPMQIWFFQKRRIVRLLDKVFDKEFNISRIEEFSGLVERRLGSKRQTVIQNWRELEKTDTPDQQVQRASAAPLEELTELYLFSEQPVPITNAVNERLAELSHPSSFGVMLRIFPDQPRDANDIYMTQALMYLMRLEHEGPTINWIPSWLAQGGRQGGADIEVPIKFLTKQCLSYFEDYEPYRLILLAACTAQRIAKIMTVSNDIVRRHGAELHALARHIGPEMSWNQFMASPNGQLIRLMDSQARAATLEFVRRNGGSNNSRIQIESAKVMLRGWWQFEETLLTKIGNYGALRKERSLGEMRMIEWSGVVYDNLGHAVLCLVDRFPKWKTYILETHKPLIESLAAMGSWSAKAMLGVAPNEKHGSISDDELADRFFLGNVATLQAIRTGYSTNP